MEPTKAQPVVTNTPPMPRNLPPPARPLGSRFVPFVAHTAGRPLSSFDFVFYRPEYSNSLAPFTSTYKAVCGYRFQEGTHQGRRVTDLENAQVDRWRAIRVKKP